MVGCTCVALGNVNLGAEGCLGVCGQLLGNVYGKVVLFLCVDNLDALVATDKVTCVAHLTSALGIERCLAKNNLIECLVLLLGLTVAQNLCVALGEVVSYELALALGNVHPVAILHGCCVACACLLFEHLLVKLGHVHSKVILAQNELCKVDGESECVVECECLDTANLLLAVGFCSGDNLVEKVDTCLQSAQECLFLLFDYLCYKLFLCSKLGISIAHILDECGNELVHKRLLLAQECVCVSYGTAQDAAYHVAGFCVRGQLSVGD